jgi:hypothetical protein
MSRTYTLLQLKISHVLVDFDVINKVFECQIVLLLFSLYFLFYLYFMVLACWVDDKKL